MSKIAGQTRGGALREVLTGPDGELLTSPAGIGWTANESLTVAGTAIPLTPDTYATYSAALISVGTAAIRFWLNGVAPTATAGHPLEVGDTLMLENHQEIVGFRGIRRDGVSAVLEVSYGRANG